MGVYLNPRNDGFAEAIHSEIYVDKTGLIAYTNQYLNTEQKFICVSRPRRFGKSMALRMLAAYYSRGCDSRELFSGMKIERDPAFADYINRFDVIFLNMQHFLIRAKKQDFTEYLEQAVLGAIRKEYGDFFSDQERILAAALEQIYADTGKKFIFLIDEWDCVIRRDSPCKRVRYPPSGRAANSLSNPYLDLGLLAPYLERLCIRPETP